MLSSSVLLWMQNTSSLSKVSISEDFSFFAPNTPMSNIDLNYQLPCALRWYVLSGPPAAMTFNPRIYKSINSILLVPWPRWYSNIAFFTNNFTIKLKSDILLITECQFPWDVDSVAWTITCLIFYRDNTFGAMTSRKNWSDLALHEDLTFSLQSLIIVFSKRSSA